MVMMNDVTPSKAESQEQEMRQGVPLDEVLGEAEARFGPMPTCLRSILLPPSSPPLQDGCSHHSVHASISDASSNSYTGTDPGLINNGPGEPDGSRQIMIADSSSSGLGTNLGLTNGTGPMEPDDTRQTISADSSSTYQGLGTNLGLSTELGPIEADDTKLSLSTDDPHEGIISLDDIALVSLSSSSSPKDTNSITQDDNHMESLTKSDTIFLDLDDDYDDRARRSPDSGCSMSEASADDKVSIASTVSASSDDGGLTRLGSQIQRLKQSMSELREQDVALARQLLIVYDYVEETKWFLENFEACDPRHSMSGPMTSTERRFSQNFQKRLSDFGLKGVPHSGGFATPPSWTELNGCQATTKRHSRNISDGMISIEHLRRIYHENNNNAASGSPDVGENPEMGDDVIPDGSGGKHRSPRPSIARRSISSSFLEINLNAVGSDHGRHHGPLSPISDLGKIPTSVNDEDDDDDDDDDDADDEIHLQSTPLPRTNPTEIVDNNTQTNSIEKVHNNTLTCDEERTCEPDIALFNTNINDHAPVNSHPTSAHHRGSPSSSSASSMMSMQSSCSSTSSSSTDTCTKPNTPQKVCTETNNPPVSVSSRLTDPTAEDCSIFIADESEDFVSEEIKHLMSSFESHMNWLQEQDETLL